MKICDIEKICNRLIHFSGAIRYRIRLRNVESDEIQVLTRNSLRIEVDELDHGTWYELAVFSVGRRNTNGEGSDVIQVQTGN